MAMFSHSQAPRVRSTPYRLVAVQGSIIVRPAALNAYADQPLFRRSSPGLRPSSRRIHLAR